MAKILFNNSGVPLLADGKNYQANITGVPADKPKNTSQPKNPLEDYLNVGDIKVSAWGPNNDFPTKADAIISSVGVLNTGLKFTRNFTIGYSSEALSGLSRQGVGEKGRRFTEIYYSEES